MHANLALTLDDVCGTWRVVRTEIPRSIDPNEEFLHFFPDGSHFWEFPLLRQPDKTWRFQYELTATGARLSTAKGHFSDIALRLEKGLLLITPSHSHTTWFQRIPPDERPIFLTLYCEPPSALDEFVENQLLAPSIANPPAPHH